MRSPFALQRDLAHGPLLPRDKVVFCITSTAGIIIALTVFGAAIWVTP